jgi:hypothetical protein
MYWKSNKIKMDFGNGLKEYTEYSFFEVIAKYPALQQYFNPVKKKIIYPVNYHLAVSTYNALSEDQFLDWYQKNKRL